MIPLALGVPARAEPAAPPAGFGPRPMIRSPEATMSETSRLRAARLPGSHQVSAEPRQATVPRRHLDRGATYDSPAALLDKLHLTRRSAVPLQTQIEAQIRYAIATGGLRAGQALPSINELARHLRINRNTAHHVYQKLCGAGLLKSRKGFGVFVAETSGPASEPTTGLPRLMARTFAAAARLGLSPLTFSHLLQTQAAAFESTFPLVAFIECNPYQADDFARQISERWQLDVRPILLSDARDTRAAVPATCRLVLTSYFHFPEVRQVLGQHPVTIRPIVLDVISDLRTKLRALPPGTTVGVITRFEAVHEVAEEMAREVRTRRLRLRTFPFRNGRPRGLKQFLDSVEVIICPDTARDAVRALGLGAKPRLIEWKAILDLDDLDAIRRSVPFLHHF